MTNYAVNKNNPCFMSNFSEKITSVGHKRSYSYILSKLARQVLYNFVNNDRTRTPRS